MFLYKFLSLRNKIFNYMALKVGDKIPEILGYDQTGKELKTRRF